MNGNHHIRVVEHDRYAEGTSNVQGDRYWTVTCSCGGRQSPNEYESHEYENYADDEARQHAAWAAFSLEVPGTITIVRAVHVI